MFNRQRRRRGFSLIELLIVIAIILIIITIALPKFTSAQRFARETSAMGAIRTIHTMQVQYYSQYGKYATSLTEMGPPTSGGPSPAAADLIDSTLAQGVKGGYKFALTPNQGGYAIHASPVTLNVDGARTFYPDHTRTGRQIFGPDPATPNSPEVK
jgi:type IV pilus assembly protein PilA